MSQNVKGTFVSAKSVAIGQVSDVLAIPTGTTTLRLTLSGQIDASNTVRTQKSINGGHTWTNQTTYNSAQTNAAVTVAAGEQWRLSLISHQAGKQIEYSLSAES